MQVKNNVLVEWFLRLAKGAFVGTGFILPGVSGGALAAIFGLYERIISFLAHPFKNFKRDILFFIPVGVGLLAGIVLLAYPLGFFLDNYKAPTMWFFIGAIIGTYPALSKEAGKQGRNPKHDGIMMLALVLSYVFLQLAERFIGGQVPQNIGTWALAGVIIALGVLVPGLSPSNFLLYMGMYDDMLIAFKQLDIAVLGPIAIGGLACVLLFSKLVDLLFKKAYAGLFHVILGVVLASTLIIVPLDYNYLSLGGLACLATCACGGALGYWMSLLENKYKPEK